MLGFVGKIPSYDFHMMLEKRQVLTGKEVDKIILIAQFQVSYKEMKKEPKIWPIQDSRKDCSRKSCILHAPKYLMYVYTRFIDKGIVIAHF